MTSAISGTSTPASSLYTTPAENAVSSNGADTSTASDPGGSDGEAAPQSDGLSGISALLAAFSAAVAQGSSTTQASANQAAGTPTRVDAYNGFLIGSDVSPSQSSTSSSNSSSAGVNSSSVGSSTALAEATLATSTSGTSDSLLTLNETSTQTNGTTGTTNASAQSWQTVANITKLYL